MSKCKITGKALSIRLGREGTQIALIGKNGEILHSTGVETPAGAVEDGAIRNYESVRQMLRGALKAPEFRHTRQVVFSLCTTQVITDTVFVPDLGGAKLEKLLMANVDMYFPVDMHDYHVVWQVIGSKQEAGQKVLQVQLWAVPKSILIPYYNVANACGLSVAAVDYCGHSIATAIGASYAKTAKAVKAQKKVDWNKPIGAKASAEEPAAAPVTDAPQTDLHITLERDLIAMTFVQNSQVVLQRLIQCGANPSYQFGEIAMMVDYFGSMEVGRGSRINVVVSGSLSGIPAMVDNLREVLGLPLEWFTSEYMPGMILCAGAARTDLDFGITTLNSPSKARKQVSGHLWQYVLVLAGGLALAAVVMITLSSRLMWNAEIRSLQNTQQTLTIQAAQSNGFADNYNQYQSLYSSYEGDWETIFTSLKTYNDNLVLVLEELEAIMPKGSDVTDYSDGAGGSISTVTGPVSIVGLQIAADGLNVQFACENKEEAAYLIMALRELQYADLVAISNLQGGGKGPATSYGSGESTVEAPPTEGSAVSVDTTLVTQLVFSQLNKDAMIDLVKGMDDEQFAALKKAYGKQPETTSESLAALQEQNAEKLTLQMRQNAISEMLMNNPFAMEGFANLLTEDVLSKNPILMPYILEDIVLLQREGKLDMDALNDPAKLRGQMALLIDVLTKDEATVTAVENLFATNEEMEKTYIHYLEVELGLRNKQLLPFLNVEKVFTDILTGGFKTENEELNQSLNALISDDVWNVVNILNSEEQMGQLVDKFMAEGSTGIDLVDSLIDNYLNAGSTGFDKLDDILEKLLGSSAMEDEMTQMLVKYLTEGTSGSEKFDRLIENYLNNGTTGNKLMDEAINAYLQSGNLDQILSEMLNKYITEGSTGNQTVDDMLEKFLRTGSTGSAALDAVIKAYLEGGSFMDKLESLLTDYLAKGTTGNDLLDELIGNYMSTGKTGNDTLDNMINGYIDEMMAQMTEDKVAELVKKYLADKTTGNDLYDALLKKYFADGTTGIQKLDELIKKYQDNIIGGGTSDDLLDLLDKFFGNSSSTETQTQQQQQVDTRIFFTATLAYNEELAAAELERKGLDYADKVEELKLEGEE